MPAMGVWRGPNGERFWNQYLTAEHPTRQNASGGLASGPDRYKTA